MRRGRPSYDAPLVEDTAADVCVVGAGIAGLSVAYELTRQGARVTVLDHGDVGGGETGRTSAHLTNALDDRFYRLARLHGAGAARLAATSHAAAIDLIEHNAGELGIDCNFRRVDGFLFAGGDRPADELDRELEAAKLAGAAVERVASAPLPFATGPALRFADQARFHPLDYLDGIAGAILARGNAIHTGVHVLGIERKGAGAPLIVQLEGGGTLEARAVVDATNASITSMARLPLRQAAYRSYVVSFEIEPGSFGDALFWDTGDPYHYLRVVREDNRELLLVGGEDHRTGQERHPERRWNAIERWIRGRAPVGRVVDTWSGQIMEPADGLAFVGKSPDLDGVYVVSGDSGHGLTHAVIASVIIPELLAGHEHPWAALYEPQRSALRGIGTMLREMVSSSVPYAGWLSGGDVGDIAEIPRGQGAVVRRGHHMIAAYRDERGGLHACSARCPHLSAVVRWNAAEQTWDCPAHGSRFDAVGRNLAPPAVGDLAPAPIGGPDAERVSEPAGTLRLRTLDDPPPEPPEPLDPAPIGPRLRPVP
jgi:glycine/D-amino acid oxidase-like deaminating enzyme/nitrite reductase/ring-hydroxylating ferredoxin subunit